jgi:lipoyl(octanoyl) transferase
VTQPDGEPIVAFASRWLGRVEYGAGLEIQDEWAREHARRGDVLLLLEHDPVYTTGRGGDEGNLPRDGEAASIPVFRVGRGGDATYHGPGQLVGYPIVDLRARGGDVHRYLRDLESVVVASLDHFGVRGFADPGRTGVWVDPDEPRKIASIGIGVRRGISRHGFALNVALDLAPFDAIVPCALTGVRMTSIERERAESPPSVKDVADVVAARFGQRFAVPPHVFDARGALRVEGGADRGKTCGNGM